MKRIADDEGLSWEAFCDTVGAPRTIDTEKNDMAASKVRQGMSLDAWYEAAVAERMKGKEPKRKEPKALIEPARKPVKARQKKEEKTVERRPREIFQTPRELQPTMWEAE